MKVVYHCYGGAHASPTAAAIHLGLLPRDRRPGMKELIRNPHFDRLTDPEHGKMIKAGVDPAGNEVYYLARRDSPRLVINLIKEFTRLQGGNPDEYLFVNCMQILNPLMMAGGYSSRALGWIKLGRAVAAFGTYFSYTILASVVKRTLQQINGE
ncbi:MAG: DUF3189 family protein [Firmicutes bacterium]|nr:DUF3189 family protein [Bacillota bacterium]